MKRLVLIVSSAMLLSACNGGPNKTNIELIRQMMDQISIKSQDWDPREGDKLQMRVPPAGTIARGHTPYLYADNPNEAEKLSNPLLNDRDPAMVALGQRKYEIYCGVCHGATGEGNGTVAEKMAVKPRNLLTDESKAYSDGRIYHAITAGRGVMGAYASQIPDAKARWAIVNYVRTLQKKR